LSRRALSPRPASRTRHSCARMAAQSGPRARTPPLINRRTERGLLDQLVDAVRAGESRRRGPQAHTRGPHRAHRAGGVHRPACAGRADQYRDRCPAVSQRRHCRMAPGQRVHQARDHFAPRAAPGARAPRISGPVVHPQLGTIRGQINRTRSRRRRYQEAECPLWTPEGALRCCSGRQLSYCRTLLRYACAVTSCRNCRILRFVRLRETHAIRPV
jgi:hypothetical protein